MLKAFILVVLLILINSGDIQQCAAQSNAANQRQKQEIRIPNSNKILSLSRSNLSTETSKVGDIFQARTVENLNLGNTVIIPSGSIVTGQVTAVRKPKRIAVSKDGFVKVSINQVQTPDGQTIALTGREVIGVILSPYYKTNKRKIAERIPIMAATNGTSIPLNQATDLNGGVVYSIQIGASVVAGFTEGLVVPDPGKTRIFSAFRRGYEATPLGAVTIFFERGKSAGIDSGSPIVLNFDKETVAKIQTQYFAQAALR